MAAAALVAGLTLVIAMPGVAFAWDSYSFSPTEEGRMLTLINQWRAANNKPAVTVDATLAAEARTRSKTLYDAKCFTHDCNGNGTADAIEQLKAQGYCWVAGTFGEILQGNNYPDDQTTQVAFNGWKNSSAHNAVLLGSGTKVGIGIFKGDGRDGTGYFGDSAAWPAHLFTAIFVVPCASATPKPTPRPTATATPRPIATATPRPIATPRATPRPTPKPTAVANPTPTPGATPEPTPAVTPAITPAPPPEALDPIEALGSLASDPRYWPGSLRSGSSTSEPSSGESSGPGATPGGFQAGDAPGLQIVEPMPDGDLLDSIVGGVAGTFFGH